MLVHELIPLYLFSLHSGDKTWYGFLVNSGCLLSRKLWWAVLIGSFCPKLRYFTDQNEPKRDGHMKMDFDYFQIQKWTFQTVIAKKVDIKNGVICLVSVFPLWVMVLKLSKKCIFGKFVLTSARSLSLLKQCTYI